MGDKYKNREKPSLKHLIGELENKEQLVQVLVGHLVIEYILVKIIDTYLVHTDKFDTFRLSFPEKVNICISMATFDEDLGEFLKKINKIRNNFAHKLGYKLDFKECFDLVNEAANAGIDFSDETIYTSEQKSREWYGIEGILSEVIANTAQELAWILYEKDREFLFN